MALSAAGQLVASSDSEGTVRPWAVSSSACLRVVRPDRRQERLDITRLSGITAAQHAALALGAVEQHGPATQVVTSRPPIFTQTVARKDPKPYEA